MSPIKVMPLLLAAIAPFVMVSGVARAAEAPIVLAQATPDKDKKDEHKQQHGQPQQPQKGQPQPPHSAPPPQPHPQAVTPPPHPQAATPQHPQAATPPQGSSQSHTVQQSTGQQPQDKVHQDHKAAETTHGQQTKQLEDQHKAQELKAKEAADAQKRAQDAAKLRSDQVKIQQQQQQIHHEEHQLQQAHHEEHVLHHELSAEDKRAKAERDAHAADRTRLIEKQKQMASQEKNPAAINERLRLQNEGMHAITSQRHQTVDAHGQAVITEPGRTILQVNGHVFIQHDETANFRAFGGIPQTRRGPNGNAISTIVRPDGVRIEIEVDGFGRPLRRVRYLPDGRRFVLFENRALAIGAGLALGALIVSLPPVEVDIPREQYIVDADDATEDDIYGALQAGPIGVLDRAYSLEEVLASVGLRERMRSVSIDSINFEFGSSDVGPDQAEMLESVAAVIRNMANQNPGEVFLVEGHTDAVGSEVDNLSLSDRRAEAVADVLSRQFNIPRENLVTQGYGKQFLLIPTPEPERKNRRVVIRRITPLLQSDAAQYSGGDGGPADQEPR
jgi:outer membrane protein OmpA-like peptidoglycan-associated protein